MGNKPRLGRVDFVRYQEQKVFEKRLRACVLAIWRWKMTNTHYENIFYKMLNMLKASLTENVHMLPCRGFGFRTTDVRPDLMFRLNDKYNCLRATLAFILLQGWQYQNMLVSSGRINHMINYLENIVAKELNSFEIRGNVRKGWRLHEKSTAF